MEKLPEYCFLSLQWWPICMGKSEWAAWVQAVGSVLAILAAVGIAYWQHARDARQRIAEVTRRRARQLESAFQLTYGVQALCEKVIAHCEGQQANSVYFSNHLGELTAIRAMLNKFAPEEFDGYAELEPVVAAMAAADAMIQQLRKAAEITDTHDQTQVIRMAFRGAIDSVREHVQRMKVVADRAGALVPK